MLVLKSTHDRKVFALKGKIEGLQSQLVTLESDKELENEQNESLFNKLQAQKKQIEGLQTELKTLSTIQSRVSVNLKKLKKDELLEEIFLLTVEKYELNNIITEIEASPEEKITEEVENLSKKVKEAKGRLKTLEDSIEVKEKELEEKEQAALAKIKPNKALLKEFKKIVKDLPSGARGVCLVKEKGKTKKIEITSKDHAEEIIKKCESGELEFVR